MLKRFLKWIPNLFTLGNLLLGFISTIISLTSNDDQLIRFSAVLIILAAFLDGLDGFFARILNATSEIGAELDSLADLTTFGIAPGALFYKMFLTDIVIQSINPMVSLGMLIACIYPAAVAFRLARFNVYHSEDSFDGLPSPIGGLIVALMPFLHYHLENVIPDFIYIIIFFISSYLMVSTIKYSKIQVSLFRRFSKVRVYLLFFSILFILLFFHFMFGFSVAATILFFLILLYIISGILSFIIQMIQHYKL